MLLRGSRAQANAEGRGQTQDDCILPPRRSSRINAELTSKQLAADGVGKEVKKGQLSEPNLWDAEMVWFQHAKCTTEV